MRAPFATGCAKVRPWFQHRAHMHVRLIICPAG
ncbi:penicillin-insensitive murein endopeptidase [Escherichia coli]|nr:penicillin-insensitive murein endopeptidase [Escherichia coli]